MNNNSSVTEEELRALMPYYEVENSYFKRIKKRIGIRTGIIGLVLVSRAIVAFLYPELFVQTNLEPNPEGPYLVSDVILVRGLLLLVIGSIYIYSLWTNKYFRTVSVVGLIVAYSLFWSDLEANILSAAGGLTTAAVILLLTRLFALALLFANYLDIRR